MADLFGYLEEASQGLARDVQLVLGAIDGAYSRIYRQDPSIRGLQAFLSETLSVEALAVDLLEGRLREFEQQSVQFRTAFDPESPGSPETQQIAAQQLQALVQSLRLAAARRFKAALVSRLSVAPAQGSLRVLNRAGQAVQAYDALYLMGRKAMLDIFNDAQVEGLRFMGQHTAQIVHKDPDHPTHGTLIKLTDEGSGITYAEAAATLLHPRASAFIDQVK